MNNETDNNFQLNMINGNLPSVIENGVEKKKSFIDKLKEKKGIFAIIGGTTAVLGKVLKLKFLLAFIKGSKFLGTFMSMGITIFIYAKIYGWIFGIGFVALIFCHEMGHYIAAKKIGLKVGAPIFIPFLGAFVAMKQIPKDSKEEAFTALWGPLFGTICSVIPFVMYFITKNHYYLALSLSGFMLNLFNLIPFGGLDGGRIVKAVSPKLWLIGLPFTVFFIIKFHSIILILILIQGISSIYGYYINEDKTYYNTDSKSKLIYGVSYFGLIGFLSAITVYICTMLPIKI